MQRRQSEGEETARRKTEKTGIERRGREVQRRVQRGRGVWREEMRVLRDMRAMGKPRRESQLEVQSELEEGQEMPIIDFMKEHPELYTKENARYVGKVWKDALWTRIGKEVSGCSNALDLLMATLFERFRCTLRAFPPVIPR